MRRNYGGCYDPCEPGWTGKAQPGVVAFSRAVMALYAGIGTLGIVRDRGRCGTTSCHCRGRAWDAKCDATKPDGLALGNRLAADLVANASALGVQRIIWNRRQWTRAKGWYAYRGRSPHVDHLHIDFCWSAARDDPLTESYVREVLGGGKPVTREEFDALEKRVRAVEDEVFTKRKPRRSRIDALDDHEARLSATAKDHEKRIAKLEKA